MEIQVLKGIQRIQNIYEMRDEIDIPKYLMLIRIVPYIMKHALIAIGAVAAVFIKLNLYSFIGMAIYATGSYLVLSEVCQVHNNMYGCITDCMKSSNFYKVTKGLGLVFTERFYQEGHKNVGFIGNWYFEIVYLFTPLSV